MTRLRHERTEVGDVGVQLVYVHYSARGTWLRSARRLRRTTIAIENSARGSSVLTPALRKFLNTEVARWVSIYDMYSKELSVRNRPSWASQPVSKKLAPQPAGF